MKTRFTPARRIPAFNIISPFSALIGAVLLVGGQAAADPFDAFPFGLPMPNGESNGVMWEDPREIHRVVVEFKDAAPPAGQMRLEYWGSWWPDRHLPKDREPGGGDIGWLELGNWWKYGWRTADAEMVTDGRTATFTFRPVNAKEFPKVREYPATFRYTLKIRIVSDELIPKIERIQAFTDSVLEGRAVRIVWEKGTMRPPKLKFSTASWKGWMDRPRKASGSVCE